MSIRTDANTVKNLGRGSWNKNNSILRDCFSLDVKISQIYPIYANFETITVDGPRSRIVQPL